MSGNILKIGFASKNELARAYIKQFKQGGIFIADNHEHYELGAEIFLIINLPESNEPLAINGKVQWLSPSSAVGYPAGIGILFNSDRAGQDARSKIEIMLGGLLQNNMLENYTF